MADNLFTTVIASDDIVVQVGAEDEDDTLTLSKLARQVYVFEPNPFNRDRLKHAMRKKRNVQLFNLGAGTREEAVKLRLPQLADQPFGSRRAQVQFTRLDKVELGLLPTCLVLNCGGQELKALRGAEGLFLKRTIRTVLMKTHQLTGEEGTGAEATLWLLDRGFRTEAKKAPDGSLWILARNFRASAPKTVGVRLRLFL